LQEAGVDERSRRVLAAADNWLVATRAVTVACEERRQGDAEQAVLDTAEVKLAAMIMEWQEAGRPDA
jgi:hypothetical protein